MTDLFGSLDKLGRGLDAAWTKNEVISSNIANIDTPGYKRRTVEFGNLLEEAKVNNLSKNGTALPGVKISIDDSTDSMRTDGNNVNIDTEMVELAKNSIYYNLLSQKVTSEIQKIESAIKG
ncbi:MAG: flagellar basal body rod protein FlgB [Clostridiales bacterium]|nr:flagellar basal body rod protein FlgB [Clostridiales bacterium]